MGKTKAIGVIAQGLINKARSGDTTSMIFFLKTQAGWRETSRIGHGLPEEPEEAPEEARQHLADIINAIAGRQTAWDELEARDQRGPARLPAPGSDRPREGTCDRAD